MGPSYQDLKPIAAMVIVQVFFAGANIFYKLATIQGMNPAVLIAYRNVFGTAFLGPLAFFVERKSRQRLTWLIVFQAFLCGLFGATLAQGLYMYSLKLTSATFASATTNITPAITFTLAIILRLETLAIQTFPGRLKVLGTTICISGAMLLTFYKGVEFSIWPWRVSKLKHTHTVPNHDSSNLVMGSVLAFASALSYSIWMIIQAKMNRTYPSYYSSIALMCSMASIQSIAFALFLDHSWSTWALHWDIKLIVVIYAGVGGSGLMNVLIAWCLRRRGPLFVSVWSPLMPVIVAILGSIILDEKLPLGCVLGSILIVTGLYAVLWGKAQEVEKAIEPPIKSSKEATEVHVHAIEH